MFRETRGAAMTGQRDWNVNIVDTTRIVMTPTRAGQQQAVSRAMDTARDIIDRRVNALGTREPTIIREGDDRIVVQVPGLDDQQKLKDMIGKTAKLEFRMVDANADPAAAARSEENTSEIQSIMRSSDAVFCRKKKTIKTNKHTRVMRLQ